MQIAVNILILLDFQVTMIVKSKDTLRAFLSSQKSIGKTTGFIPTMGALHQGHLSLVERANAECDIVIVSIFVNPTQFNDSKDLDQYPRDLDADVKLLKSFVPESIVFAPSAIELYNGHITAKKFDFEIFWVCPKIVLGKPPKSSTKQVFGSRFF